MTGRRPTALVLAALLTGVAGFTPLRAAADQDEYNRGRNAVFEERWNDVREIFDDFESRFPASPHADDAQYWLGMALYELGMHERGYQVLKGLPSKHAESPWIDDARVLMVRCAEAIIKSESGKPGFRRGDGIDPATTPSSTSTQKRIAEYEDFLDESTRDASPKVQLLAIDSVLESNPAMARELLLRLNAADGSPETIDMILDRFFGESLVKVTMADPSLGLTDENVAVMVRTGDTVHYLTLSDAARLAIQPNAAGAPFDPSTIAEIGTSILAAQRHYVRDAGHVRDAGRARGSEGDTEVPGATIVKVMDGELHHYRSGAETTRILVLNRDAGFRADNIRVYVEGKSGISEIPLEEARAFTARNNPLGLSAGTINYLKAALAIIEIDLTRPALSTPR